MGMLPVASDKNASTFASSHSSLQQCCSFFFSLPCLEYFILPAQKTTTNHLPQAISTKITTKDQDALNVQPVDEAVECFFHALEFVNVAFIEEGRKIPRPRIRKSDQLNEEALFNESLEGMLINMIVEDSVDSRILPSIRPCAPGELLNNWSIIDLPVTLGPDQTEIEEDEDEIEYEAPKELLKLVADEEKQFLPHQEHLEILNLGTYEQMNEVKIDMTVSLNTRRDLISLLQEFKDVFAWTYQAMPLLKNAGETYQRAIMTLFHDMMHKEIEVYVDDMIVKSRTEGEHVQDLKMLFQRLRKYQLKLNPAKCTFGVTSRKLLGFIVSRKGIEIDTCDPVFKLIRKNSPEVWNEECQEALDKINKYLANSLVLVAPVPVRPLILYLTIYENTMGCVLRQHDETWKKERVIYYLSKKFTDYEA
ncbi:hypothetical protein V6N11_025618 [Hibiscus sabdariffa]|uniref:Reverse transcriptase domain-containing protein n=1 Tax=Hibiscus sabdariffa TaxID=183260 RepID=A0ABR2ST79_9ROSI